MTTAGRSIAGTVMIVLLGAGLLAAAAARWTRPVADADAALAAGDWDRALTLYTQADARFARLPIVRPLFARDLDRVAGAQLWLMYRLRRYDELLARAERAPEAASPHLWAGLAFLAKGRDEPRPDDQMGWLTRSEQELRRAVAADPADWDTKFNFELVTRLVAALRKSPKTPPDQLMQILRPEPKAGVKPTRRVG
jgi:hypothetical protein